MRFDAVECGKRIKALREEKRLTQMELAEQICITTDHLRAIERGRRACSIDLLVDLSLFFEVTLDHLILGRTPANEIIRAEILQAIGILQNIKNTL
jgi:transcriptional regulator with XRE-family HTH domain